MKRFILSIFLLVVTVGLVSAQNGTLRGKIIDQKTGETLIGATVSVKGTAKGAITDFDGNYTLILAPGTYDIAISFVSYETKEIKSVVVKEDEVTVINENLGDANLQLQEVTVKAKAVTRTETAMMVMQRKSAKILDGISAQQISKLGDGNAAAALKRVTGVSVQGGKYVFVRGLGDRYTKTTLNNAEIPALDPQRNTVQMDMFPSNVIENIVVNKTFTPDMPGESTGGHVDVVTRDFPEDFTMQISTSLGYNTLSSLNDKFLTYESGKYDWLGIDGKHRAIPDVAQGYIDGMKAKGATSIDKNGHYGNADLNKFTNDFSKTVAPEERTSFLNHGHKLVIGDQITLAEEKAIGYNFSVSYNHSYEYFENGEIGRYETNQLDLRKVTSSRTGNEKFKLAALANVNFKLSNNNKVGLRFLRNQAGNKIASYRYGVVPDDGDNFQERNLNYQGRHFSSGQLHGKHVLTGWNNATITWLGSYTFMKQEEPDNRYFSNNYDEANGEYRLQEIDLPTRTFRDISENDIDTKVDFELPFNFRGNKSKFKTGLANVMKDRNGDQMLISMNSGGLNSSDYRGTLELHGNWDEYLKNNVITESDKGYYYTFSQSDLTQASYEANSRVTSVYAMADMKINEKLRVVFGARFENYYVKAANKVDENEPTYKGNSTTTNNVLPSLNFTYSLTDNMNLRLAGSQTVARPVFREIAPQSFYDYIAGMRFTGNPNLEPSSITNVDLRWEYFFGRGEMIAISGFYKYFEAPIERRLDPGSAGEILYFNAEATDLLGVEAEFRKKLDFIGFEGLSFGSNVTLVQSSVRLTENERQWREGSTRPMLGQAPFLINAYLSYSNTKSKFDANLGFNVGGRKMFLITAQNTPYIYEKPRELLNFTMSKGFGDHWSVDLSINNILNAPYEAAYMEDIEKSSVKYEEGVTYQIGVKYRVN